MSLKDTRWLPELSEETGIPKRTLSQRVSKLIEEGKLKKNIDYKQANGKRQPILLDKSGIEKVLEKGK